MKNNSLWKGIKNYIYKHYGQESGKMLVHVGLITWTVACLSQVAAVLVNDKIPKEQKKFLLPQELADGAINILSFYLITNSMKDIGSKLVSTGKWSTKAIRDFVEAYNQENPKMALKLGDMQLNLGKIFKEDEKFHESYDTFKNGIDMMSTVTGAVISGNFVTPFIRNAWAAKRQKESLEKERSQGINSYKNNIYPNSGQMKI